MKQTQRNKEKLRIVNILISIPTIRNMIKAGNKWERLKCICEPLGLNDTSFRDNPQLNDYLLDPNYWLEKLRLDYLMRKRFIFYRSNP